jgi:hypothetical protein
MNIFELIFVYLFVLKAEGLPLYYWQNDTDRGKPKHTEEYLSKCQVVHHESRKNGQELNKETAIVEAGDSKYSFLQRMLNLLALQSIPNLLYFVITFSTTQTIQLISQSTGQ